MSVVAPDLGSCIRDICGCAAGSGFFVSLYTGRSGAALRPKDGETPGEFFSRRDLGSWPGTAYAAWSLAKEPATGVIAWVVPGLAAGLTARMVTPGRRSRGCAISSLPGIAGALPGSRAAIGLLHIRSLQRFFNRPTWLTAVGGEASLLAACHLVTGRRGRRGHR